MGAAWMSGRPGRVTARVYPTPMGTDVLLDPWVDYPLYQVLEDFEVSLEEDSGTPGPRW